ncbi:hypothetical protein JZ751_022467 [Albula glossodonta]|uniref:HMG box domain-containing protein n=1 Tax=Albula glossodonta TaxID=121402 RepID=A0A8T2NL92_9TELE|nr:hypothetical protein JZ751_022467 [Albula glossodonta]
MHPLTSLLPYSNDHFNPSSPHLPTDMSQKPGVHRHQSQDLSGFYSLPPGGVGQITSSVGWQGQPVYPISSCPGFRQPYPSSLPSSSSYSRFPPSLVLGPSGMHPTGIPHPAIVPPTGKQEHDQYERNMYAKPHPEPKREKEPKKPVIKKPLNAFMLYMKEMRAKVIAECTLKESAAINQILGRRWHALTREEQAKYYELARKERQLHMQLYPSWSARDNYGKKKRRKREKQQDSNSDPGSPKKCRARFGLNQQTDWCGPCRCVSRKLLRCFCSLPRPAPPLSCFTLPLPPPLPPALLCCACAHLTNTLQLPLLVLLHCGLPAFGSRVSLLTPWKPPARPAQPSMQSLQGLMRLAPSQLQHLAVQTLPLQPFDVTSPAQAHPLSFTSLMRITLLTVPRRKKKCIRYLQGGRCASPHSSDGSAIDSPPSPINTVPAPPSPSPSRGPLPASPITPADPTPAPSEHAPSSVPAAAKPARLTLKALSESQHHHHNRRRPSFPDDPESPSPLHPVPCPPHPPNPITKETHHRTRGAEGSAAKPGAPRIPPTPGTRTCTDSTNGTKCIDTAQ